MIAAGIFSLCAVGLMHYEVEDDEDIETIARGILLVACVAIAWACALGVIHSA